MKVSRAHFYFPLRTAIVVRRWETVEAVEAVEKVFFTALKNCIIGER